MESLKRSLKGALEQELAQIPKVFRQGAVVHQTIKCVLYVVVKEADLWPVPDFRPPRLRDGFVDLIGVDSNDAVKCAFAIGPVVELKGVKSLEALDTEEKWMITYSNLSKKVKESTFFLKPGIKHLHLEQE
ncbi:MAG: hypothetical protein JSU72_10790 [Deltaproteobacteria bacterium]|nr:MAG: hypothetical protein JSU72_10790 [Deltaproteobacteria bacterium]